jgi:hypothetical protein
MSCWLLEGHVARLNLPGLALAFDADRPAYGLAKIVVLDRPWSEARLLGVTGSIESPATTTLADWHVRGDDLIAVYEMGQPDAARFDLLWHAARPIAGAPWLARIDLLVSVRTDRLDWRHDVRLDSLLPEVTADGKVDSSGIVFRETARCWSLVLMVHPADLGRQELTAESGPSATRRLQQQLFRTQSLEKGVILRARARAWFLPSGIGTTVIAECLAEFAAADPPLGLTAE